MIRIIVMNIMLIIASGVAAMLFANFIMTFASFSTRLSMNISDFFYKYYVLPIQMHAGYNVVNTLTYAILALLGLYVVYVWFKKEGWAFDMTFAKSLLPWLLFGSTKRVITDAVYAGTLSGPFYSLYQWSWFNVSPAIYVFTAVLFFISFWLEKRLGKKGLCENIGWLFFTFHFLLLLPALRYLGRALIVVGLWLLVYGALLSLERLQHSKCCGWVKSLKLSKLSTWAVLGQALDGAATFIGVSFFGYGEQHVLSSFIGNTFGYGVFFILKVIIAFALAWYVERCAETEDEKNIILLAVLTVGVAPGFRDLLRLTAGV